MKFSPKVIIIPAIFALGFSLSACQSQQEWEEQHKPCIQVSPSGVETLCIYERIDRTGYSEWECEVIK